MILDINDNASVVEFLSAYNKWRRDQSSIDDAPAVAIPDPTEIGMAIDAAIRTIKLTDQRIARLERHLAEAQEAGKRLAQQALAAERERDILRNVCGEAYQMAGALDAPVSALDNLSAASMGLPIPHESFLPVQARTAGLLNALHEIAKYWNGDNNELAMADACEHNAETAKEALEAYYAPHTQQDAPEAAEPAPPKRPELKAGQVWKDRRGKEVELVENTDIGFPDIYPFKDAASGNTYTYTETGHFADEDSHSSYDLVELVRDVEPTK